MAKGLLETNIVSIVFLRIKEGYCLAGLRSGVCLICCKKLIQEEIHNLILLVGVKPC